MQPKPMVVSEFASNQELFEAYQEAHPELHVLDEFGFFTGYALSFDIDAGQPPDEATFAALVVSGSQRDTPVLPLCPEFVL